MVYALVQELRTRPKGAPVVMLVACIYAYGATVLADAELDSGAVQRYAVQVLDMHVSRGRHTSYYLRLSAWGPRTLPEDVDVGQWLYENVEVGNTVCVYLKPGALGIPWFAVATCPRD